MDSDTFAMLLVGILLMTIGAISACGRVKRVMQSFDHGDAFASEAFGFETVAAYTLCSLGIAVGILAMINFVTYQPPPPNNLIILDIDGVLNHNKAPKRINISHLYDPACVERLNHIIKETHAKLLVCSAWRIGSNTVSSMQSVLESIGVEGEVIGLTPSLNGEFTRDDEITLWLEKHMPVDLFGMVYIDDDVSKRFKDIQVRPSWETGGLQDIHVQHAMIKLHDGLDKDFSIGKVATWKSKTYSEMNFGGRNIQQIPSPSAKMP